MIRENPKTTGHLGYRETASLLTIMLGSRIFLGMPRLMAEIGGTAAWITVTLAFAAALTGYYLLDLLLSRFEGSDLVEIAGLIFRPLRYPVGLIYFAFFLSVCALVTRIFAETFIVGLMPRTPIGIISGLIFALLVFASYMGIETISRLAILYAPYLSVVLIGILILASPSARFQHLVPWLGPGIGPQLLPGLSKSSVFADIVFLGFLAPFLRQRSKRRLVGLTAMGGGYLIFLLSTIFFAMVFDYPASTQAFFPIFQLTRLISLMEFFQRAEAIFIFLWFFVAVIALSSTFFASAHIFARTFALRSHRPVVFPLAVLAYALSLIPASFIQATRLDGDILRRLAWIPAFALPALLLAMSLLLGRKGADQT